MAEPTLRLVHMQLGWISSDLVYQPDLFWIGTPSFQVEIFYPCSGYEGIILISVFVAIYLWLFRKDLNFPQAFWLLPLGIIAIWLANTVRIAMLIVIGRALSPKIAVEGFHSQAGWIAFILITLGLIVLSHRLRFFMADQASSSLIQSGPSLATALLGPLMVLMAVSMVTLAFSDGFEALYPLQVVAVATALWYYRKVYRELGWTWSWQAAAIGVVVFLLWRLLEPSVDGRGRNGLAALATLSTGSPGCWLAFRVFGSVFIVPLVEELAFRGYLLSQARCARL